MARAPYRRLVAPAALLAAATAAVLLVRAGLGGSGASQTARPTARTEAVPAARRAPRPLPRRYVVVRAGDSLAEIARRLGVEVAQLEHLNPGVRPTSLRIGQRLRVR